MRKSRLADMPEVPGSPPDAAVSPPEVQAVLDGMEDMPACVYNGKYDLLAWNDTFSALFPSLTADGSDRNALWYAFTHREGENPFGSDECLAQMVATVRSAFGRHIGEPTWTTWVERMSTASPLFAALWASNRVSTPIPLERELHCAGHGTLRARTTSFAVTGAPETRLVVHIPAQREDYELLEHLRQKRPHAARSTSCPG